MRLLITQTSKLRRLYANVRHLQTYRKSTHLLFDLDGLLIDSEKCYKQAISDIATRYGKVYTDEIRQKIVGTPELETSRIAVEELQLPITRDEFLKDFRKISEEYLANVELKPGADALVRHLHASKVPIAIATSSHINAVEFKTRKYKDLFKLFSHVVCASSDPAVTRGKPHPDVFLVCAERFNPPAKPISCLVFEDSCNGVLAAIAAGMQVVMVPEDPVPENFEQKATICVKSLENLDLSLFGLPPINSK